MTSPLRGLCKTAPTGLEHLVEAPEIDSTYCWSLIEDEAIDQYWLIS